MANPDRLVFSERVTIPGEVANFFFRNADFSSLCPFLVLPWPRRPPFCESPPKGAAPSRFEPPPPWRLLPAPLFPNYCRVFFWVFRGLSFLLLPVGWPRTGKRLFLRELLGGRIYPPATLIQTQVHPLPLVKPEDVRGVSLLLFLSFSF